MTVQRLHSAFAPIDVLTRLDLEAMQHQWFEEAMRTKLRGLDAARFPRTFVTATAATFQLFANANEAPNGPEQGDVWMIRRIIVKSNVLSDTAKFTLYRGSAPSDIANAYGMTNLLEGFGPGSTAVVVASPAIGASPFTYVNTNNVPVNVQVTGGTITSIAVNGTALSGVTSGTFTLQPDASITVTYTVAPTTFAITNTQVSVPPGQNVNLGYYPPQKALLLQPGEQVYAQIQGATIGNQYELDGEGIRVPAEMKGKVF